MSHLPIERHVSKVTPRCTVSVAGGMCGKEAVATFSGTDGHQYFECIDHAPKAVVKTKPAPRIRKRPDGLDVPVGRRAGRDFPV